MRMLLLTLLLALAPQAPNTAPKATIEGSVFRAGTTEAIASAQIALIRVAGPTGAQLQPGGTAPALTDSQGRFTVRNIDPGTYRLYAARNGFTRQEYGQRTLTGLGTVLTITPGQSLKDVVFRLTPAASVTGRILDSAGVPMTGVTVQLLRVAFDSTGKRTLRPAFAARTDDRGEYRLYWITPGQYYAAVTPRGSSLDDGLAEVSQLAFQYANQPGPARPDAREIFEAAAFLNNNEVIFRKGYATTYYPGATDAARALAIEVKPGAEIGGININPQLQPLAHVRGRLTDAGGQPVRGAIARLLSIDGQEMGIAAVGGATPGAFEFADVIPGTYVIRALVATPLPGAAVPAPGARGAGARGAAAAALANAVMADARAQITVSGNDLDNVALTAQPGVAISGRIQAEGLASISELPGFDRMNVVLAAADEMTTQPATARVTADGTFRVENVFQGRYRIRIDGRPTDVFMKTAGIAGTDLMRDVLNIGNAFSGTLEVVVSPKAGKIEGTVVDRLSKPSVGIQVVLVPNELRPRRELYRTATTDGNGRFALGAITPGDYKVFAWEDFEPFSYFDADVIRKFEQQGAAVQIREASASTVEVKLIPAGVP